MKHLLKSLFFLVSLPLHATVVTSISSESLFVCNAGISHVSDPSSYGMDSIAISFQNTLVPVDSPVRFQSTVLSVAAGELAQVFETQPVNIWKQSIDSTNFNFTTEKYGSSYFIDLCYRGPEAKQPAGPGTPDLSEGIYILDLNLNLDELSASGANYHSAAQLASKVEVTCDLRTRGAFKNPRPANDLISGNLEMDSFYSSDLASWTGGAQSYQIALNDTYTSVPRFCKLRVIFQENAVQNTRNNLLILRDVDLFLNINQN